ncbi:rab escort protein 1 isoform X1 [Lycium barbarum]|uniref:rab escort protein 1 isoform X1 n=2 Tax=Lycium barbarum TaxID=112863 RepID=UPI00293E7D89|nr:rab escort protein 1 isoform X1 [Lycium barbarum]
MDETTSYPPIEPSNFDLIVIGTGLPESILAAAASAAGKSVLHLDPNPNYGSHYASLTLNEFTSYIQSQSSQSPIAAISRPEIDSGYTRVGISTRPVYSSVEINSYGSEPLEQSRKFNIDLSGPRVLLCADGMIDLILKSEVNQYMEFKGIDGSFMGDGEGNLENVPDSRSAIFKDRKLSFTEKNQLMRFFKMVQGHLGGGESERISEQDLESSFVDFLSKMGLSKKLKSIILYAIAMADYDQEIGDLSKSVLKTKDGIDRLALYHSSVGRFPNAPGAMIYPIYGQGELPQAFCRRAAVKGCIYVLRMPVNCLLMDKASGSYKGVCLASEQELFSHKLIVAPSFVVESPPPHSSPDALQNVCGDFGSRNITEKLVRSICISKHSLKLDVANCLAFFPPRSLFPEQVTAVRALQLSSNVAVCPSGMYLTYLSAICDDDVQGKKLLNAAINVLFHIPVSGSSGNNDSAEDQSETRDAKPALLWSVLYTQELAKLQDVLDNIICTPTPDGSPYYHDLLGATEKIFQELYSGEEFFPKSTSPEEGAGQELED